MEDRLGTLLLRTYPDWLFAVFVAWHVGLTDWSLAQCWPF